MAQHDQIIDNGPGRAVRLDIIAAFAALFSTNSGVLPPVVTVGGQLWFDTSDPLNPRVMFRNAANTAWLDIADDLVLKNPTLTGTATAPTPPAGDNDTSVANTAFVTTAVANAINAIKGGVSTAYDTLKELADGLATKAALVHTHVIADIVNLQATLNGKANGAMTFNWAGQGGQPDWLWGGNASNQAYVWNPSNFSVAYAANTNFALIGSMGAGGAGTYALAVRTSGSGGYGFGATIAGSSLTSANGGGGTAGGSQLAGTWRCMGVVGSGSNEATLWLRI